MIRLTAADALSLTVKFIVHLFSAQDSSSSFFNSIARQGFVAYFWNLFFLINHVVGSAGLES